MDKVVINFMMWIGGFLIGLSLHDTIMQPKTIVENSHIQQRAEKVAERNNMQEDKMKIIKFHDAVCNESHTDSCGWLHEIIDGEHRWDLPAHKRWSSEYKKAKKINFEGYYEKIQYRE